MSQKIFVVIIGDQVKEIWKKLVEGYKDFVRNGKKISPSGDGARKSGISKTTYDLFKFMGFLDGKLEHHAQISSEHTEEPTVMAKKSSTKKRQKRSIWDEDLECLGSDEDVVPPVDKFCRFKKQKSKKQDDLSELFGCVKNLTQVITENLSKGCDDAYKKKISSFFINLDENQRNNLMQKLLEVINEEVSRQ